jgi:NarL family two-component system response regulator LiaR
LRSRTRALIKQVLAYGSLAAVLLVCLQLLRNSYLLYDLSLELYLLMAGVPLLIVGIVLGRHLDNRRSMIRARQPPESELTAKELEVLGAVAEGLSNQQVADRLFVSLSTIKTHLQSIYGKLDVKRRTQAVERARRLELLD